jgi:uncharacterized protein (DUF2062 family)
MEHNLKKDALKGTLHCLAGCNIGEAMGLGVGSFVGLAMIPTMALAITLAFIVGYGMTILPLFRGLGIRKAMKTAIAGDTASISSMEFAENAVAFLIPGFIGAGFLDPIFYLGFAIILPIGFAAAYPAMYYTMKKLHEKGEHMHHH